MQYQILVPLLIKYCRLKNNIVITLLLLPFLGFTAIHPKATTFISPVKYSIRLAGTFGEIRSKHFHAGIDIRSNKGGGGDSIYSAESGYISRIKIDRSGYGKSIYITHENGYTSVYAHMNDFSKDVEAYVLDLQYKMMSYEIDIVPEADRFPLSKSEHIGFLGNTGYSFGPHLHFEIRETATDKVMNPLQFGIKPIDNIAPEITQVRISGLTPEFNKNFDHSIKIKKDKKGITSPIEMEVPAWRTGLAIKAYDKCTGCVNKNGIYKLEMFVDDTLTYSFDMNSFAFDENKLLEAHTDFDARQNENSNEILCYKLPGNNLSFIDNGYSGLIDLYEGRARKIVINVSDYHGNTASQELRLRRGQVLPYKESDLTGEDVQHGQNYTLNCEGATVLFPENSFAKNDKIQFLKNPNNASTYEIINNLSPILKKFALSVKIPDSLLGIKEKLALVKTSAKGGNISFGCEIKGDSISTQSDEAGLYRIFIDDEAPTIKPLNFTAKPKTDVFRFKLNDNLYCRNLAKDFSYNVWIDDRWLPCEYKELIKTLYVPLKGLEAGSHNLKIKVADQYLNTGSWEGSFNVK